MQNKQNDSIISIFPIDNALTLETPTCVLFQYGHQTVSDTEGQQTEQLHPG